MKNSATIKKNFEGITLNVIPDNVHGFVITTAEVAEGYGITCRGIRLQLSRHADELTEGKHFIKGGTKCNTLSNAQPHQTYWTQKGIVRLGFFIKSEKAKRFRDWAEDLIVGGGKEPIVKESLQDRLAKREWLKEPDESKQVIGFLQQFGLFEGVKVVNVRGNKL